MSILSSSVPTIMMMEGGGGGGVRPVAANSTQPSSLISMAPPHQQPLAAAINAAHFSAFATANALPQPSSAEALMTSVYMNAAAANGCGMLHHPQQFPPYNSPYNKNSQKQQPTPFHQPNSAHQLHQHQGSSSSPSTPNSAPSACSSSTNSINRSQRCGVCKGCQCKPCGNCTYCQDSPQFGGPGVKKQSCIERRCLRVLENRLQRDAPTFKARVGCAVCEDCRMPNCQVCLVCLDRRFFNGRYMNGALCAKKRCSNPSTLELPSHSGIIPQQLLTSERQILKRSHENANTSIASSSEAISTTKRRNLDSPHHHQKGPVNHSNDEKFLSTENDRSVIVHDGCSRESESVNRQKSNFVKEGRRNHQNKSEPILEGGIFHSQSNYGSAAPTSAIFFSDKNAPPSTTISQLTSMIPSLSHQQHQMPSSLPSQPQQHLHVAAPFQYGYFSLNPSAMLPLPPAQDRQHFGLMAAQTANGHNHLAMMAAYHHHQQQQQYHQRFVNYPKYEYGDDEMVMDRMSTAAVHHHQQPQDPFVPPSYSEMKNAVVLQPL